MYEDSNEYQLIFLKVNTGTEEKRDPMEEPYPSSIELKLISCKDLRAFNFFQKLTVYAFVYIASSNPKTELNDEQKQHQRTQTDRDSDRDGTNPEWNHETRFDLGWVSLSEIPNLFFHFEFHHDGVILGDKLIGECRVPLVDLVRDAGSVGGVARFVSYEVRSGDGKPNGVFNFSYKIKGIDIGSGTHTSQILEGRISGYPLVDQEHHLCDSNQSSQVQYPKLEIENTGCYPTAVSPVTSVHEGFVYSPPPAAEPVVFSPSCGECQYYYPPPPMRPPCPYAPPPLPPVAQGAPYYPPFGPGAHPWPSGPNFEHRW